VAKVEPTSPHPGEDLREIVECNAMKAADRLGLDSEMRTLLNMPFREFAWKRRCGWMTARWDAPGRNRSRRVCHH